MSYRVKLDPTPIQPGLSVRELVEHHLYAYNAARLREACQLFAHKIANPDVTIGVTLSGALTPTGLGTSTIVPLIRAGLIDWIVSTGANLYHDMHRSLGFELWGTTPHTNDIELREQKLIRIYDILFDQDVLLESDAFLRQCIAGPEFQRSMSTAELHYLLGRYTRAREQAIGTEYVSILTAAHECGVPLYTSSPGDSTIGMNVAALTLAGNKLRFDVEADVNETTAIVHRAKKRGGQSAVIIFGGGSPKNFILQTEPQLQEIMGIAEKGHDYFIQFTDARPDTGGLSGATPSEAMTWGKVDPDQLPDTIVCYTDSTIALPIFAAYALEVAGARPLQRLYDQRASMLDELGADYAAVRSAEAAE
ncbi:MAG TPA: deoxyhypusine synthase [Roseiflexaceae bacterium]|nr:deoxyhypusine synthase [Roseiflexaceae bacterium]HMP43003.1 deoxyhypusine synthase [Roseiflexaceae bacterium]